MNAVPILVWAERRVSAWVQDRVGPNRVGPWGLFQPIADALKLLFKEDIVPDGVDRVLFVLAPAFAFIPAALIVTVIPFGAPMMVQGEPLQLQVCRGNVGILLFLALTGLGVYGIAFAGYASNNKFALLGGLRASAQVVSYEIAMGLAIVSILMSSQSVDMNAIVADQTGTWMGFVPRWNVLRQPIAFVVFLVAAFAESNRLPFDLPECEAELVGGYHTEYSSMKFSLFFLGEYTAMFASCCMITTLFLGGWSLPGMNLASTSIPFSLLTVGVFFAKVSLLLFFYIIIRWTLPRFRFDQLMQLGWKTLIPLALANIILTGVLAQR
ncbi:MAG: NADH-quinone oxidoreductase subunit NuoH [Planctomycetes bacterium]|nr:NADH-quinone oxidoreductase subunit NuoH [Planctomycetota bacterium]